MGSDGIGEHLLLAYRELVGAEARLSEALAPRGLRVGASVAQQWPTLHEYLHLYARGTSPAGVLVLGGAPDEGSRATGIPFTGAAEARERLGLSAHGASRSPSGAAFWRAVEHARAAAAGAPMESLFGTVHLAHAIPFDYAPAPEVHDESARHVARMLRDARPQAVVAVGVDALATLARALHDADLAQLAAAPEETWVARWPPGTRLLDYPRREVPGDRPFRVRVVPVPALAGAHATSAERALERVLAYAMG